MDLLHVVFVLAVIGVVLYCINRWLPMQGTIKNILNAVVVIAVCLWLISLFFPGFWRAFNIHVGG